MRKMIKNIFPFLKQYRAELIAGILLGLLATVISAFIPKYVKEIVAVIQEGINGTIDFDSIKSMGIKTVVLIIIGLITGVVQVYMLHGVGKKLLRDVRNTVNDKMNRVPVSYYDTTSTGDILAIVTDDITVMTRFISNGICTILLSIIMIVLCLAMMFSISSILSVCVISSTIAGYVINCTFMKKNLNALRKQRVILGQMNAQVEESLTGHLAIKAFNCEDDILESFYQKNNELCESVAKSKFYEGALMPIISLSGNIAYVVICVTGAYFMLQGKTDISIVIAFLMYVTMFSNPIAQLGQNLGTMQSAIACSERVFGFLGLEDIEDNGCKKPEDKRGRVVFEHVNFGYNTKKTIIHDFSAIIEPGMKVAIVGRTGAGKSTLMNLLMRFYEAGSGEIIIDGVSIKDIKRGDLYDEVVMVPQDTWCFHGSIRDNIVYTTPNVSNEKLAEVIEKVGLTEMTKTLPDGVDTVISEKNAISAGQKQLITIARAMLKDAPILILDEATSSVDTRTEKHIQNAIDTLMTGRTSFVIAHRLSTIQNADIIFVLKDGDIVETGKHEELLAQNGFYSELYNSQFEH